MPCLWGMVLILLFMISGSAIAQDTLPKPPEPKFDEEKVLENELVDPDLPGPKNVMLKSAIIPGWGQIVNKQVWKVPLVYGLIGGVIYNSIRLTKLYHDYRAAAYNLQLEEDGNTSDLRFGPTPDYLAQGFSTRFLISERNRLRNNRDLMYILIGVAHGLNVLDAYVFAHMRTYDISDDLSMNTRITPGVLPSGDPGITLAIQFKSRKAR